MMYAHSSAENPPASSWLYRNDVRLVACGCLLYSLLYVIFWPRTYAIMDESSYLGLAYALRHGTVYTDIVGFSSVFTYTAHGHTISQYPPGMSFLLALTSLLGWSFSLGTNLLPHLATVAVIAFILQRLNTPRVFALLYLLHPTAIFYSRTVMADPPATLAIASAFAFYIQRRFGWCGFFLGLATIIRNANIVVVFLFAVALLLDLPALQRKDSAAEYSLTSRLRDWIRYLFLLGLGALPLYAAAYIYQATLQEGGWHRFSNQIDLQVLPRHLVTYIVMLGLLYPGMVLAPLLYRGAGRYALIITTYSLIMLFSAYQAMDVGGNAIESFIVGQRYLLAILPLFIVAYAEVVWRLTQRMDDRVRSLLLGAGIVLIGLAAVGVHGKHQSYLKSVASIRDGLNRVLLPNDVLFCNVHVAKLLHPAWTGNRFFTILPSDNRQLNQEIDQALSKDPTGRIVLAIWSRDYRSETTEERRLEKDIRERYHTRPFSVEERHGIPEAVSLLEIERLRTGSSPDTTADAAKASSGVTAKP